MNSSEPFAPQDLALLVIDLRIADDHALLVVLSADGDITRMGDALLHSRERRMAIGLITPETFNAMREQVTPEMLEGCGLTYDDPNRTGDRCILELIFTSNQGAKRGMR